PRLRSLRQQASRAEKYEQVRADLEAILREWYGYHWHAAQKELQAIKQEVEQHSKKLESVQKEQSVAEDTLSQIRDRINTLRGQLNSWHRQLSQIHSRREETSRELAVSGERKRALMEQEARIHTEISRAEEEIARQKTRLEEYQRRVDEAKETASIAQNELEKTKLALEARKNDRRTLEDGVETARQTINHLTGKKAELTARREELEARIARLNFEIQSQKENLEKFAADRARLSRIQKEAKQDQADARSEVSKVRERIENLEIERNAVLQQRADTLENQQSVEGKIARLSAESQVLEEAESSFSGYTSGARVLLQAARDGKLTPSARAFGSQLHVPEEYELAIAAALGDYVDAVLLDNTGESEQALEMILEESARAAILPLADLSPQELVQAPAEDGCLGVAADLVQASAELRPAVDLLLGQVLVVENRATARKILKGKGNFVRAVTMRGEVFSGSGAIQVDTGKRAATLRRPRQKKSIHNSLQQFVSALAGIEEKLNELDSVEDRLESNFTKESRTLETAETELRASEERYRQASLDLEQVGNQHAWLEKQLQTIREEITQAETGIEQIGEKFSQADDELRLAEKELQDQLGKLRTISLDDQISQVSYWEAQASLGQKSLDSAQQMFLEREHSLNVREEHLNDLVASAGEVKARLVELDYKVEEMRTSEAGIGDEIQKLNALIEPAEAELEELETLQEKEFGVENAVRQRTNQAERYYNQAQITLARRQESMDTLRQRIEADFGLVEFEYTSDVPGPSPLPFGDVVQHLPDVEEISDDLEDALKQQRLQLRRLGSVNPDAQREYHEVKERHEFLTNQVEDLTQAEKDIRQVIAELDELMERDFRRTFEVVAQEFKQVFSRLFAGGSAKLEMTEGEDLDSVGIDIVARLPGKRTQELALLSGGERSLTAAALVFSLIKASPTPFCVMDEVDAMLDEANVGRFRQVLEELSRDTQFVVITHNRHTVQAADVIYGITMGRDTTSQTISLKLEEVDERYSSD
ncbi:MAG: hypothetical protein PVI99_06370, partial [Anaerolineales bacterium]